MAWKYKIEHKKFVCKEYGYKIEAVKQALAEQGYVAIGFWPPKLGEIYLTTAALNATKPMVNFEVDTPRLILMPAVPTFDLDKEWNS